MYDTNQFRKGLKIELDGVPFSIVDYQFVSPGKGSAFVRTKLKNLLNSNVIERTFKSGDKVDRPDLENHEFQYLYKDGEHFVFMNTANYEQVPLDASVVGDAKDFLKENLPIQILFFNGKAITLDLPTFVELKIIETEPGFKGDTATNTLKPAKVETGATIKVPLHLKEGEVIKVDTRDYTYIEKVNR
jgi:elongation factor P